MTKRLLLQFLAAMGFVSASAYNAGEYIYTPDSKYKTTADNVVTNGDFSSSFAGWSNGSDETQGEPSTSAWSLVAGVGPKGETVAESASDTQESVLARMWSVDDLGGAGLYVYSYYVMSGAEGSTSVTKGKSNYLNFYVNQDGTYATNARNVADVQAFNTEWKLVTDTVNLNQGDFFVMYVSGMAIGTRIANVSINKVTQVFDDRIVEAKKAYVEELLANGWMTNGKEDFLAELQEYYNAFKGAAGDDPDDIDAMNAYVESVDDCINAFLENNSASMMGNFKHWNTTSSKYQKTSGIGDWVFTGGRWFHCNSNDSDERERLREYVDFGIGRAYDMPDASATVTKTWDPGKYFMKLDVRGYYMLTNTSAYYDADLNSEVKGCTIFGGNVTKDLGTLETRNDGKTYTLFFEIPEDQAGVENNVKFGFNFVLPEDEKGKKRGGNIQLGNLIVRRIGLSEEQLAHNNLVDEIATAQHALKVMIDSAKVVATKDEYKWGKAQMNDSTAKGEAEYQASLAKVDANGKEVKVDDDLDADYSATLNSYMAIVRKGMVNLYGYCQPYFDLKDAVAEADAKLADPLNANGDATLKGQLETAISEAKALYATYAVLDDDATILAERAKYNEKLAALTAAQAAYLITTASVANPTSIAITNPDFTSKTSGWTLSESIPGKETFKSGADDSYASGRRAAVWRGNTVSPQSKLVQKVTLTHKGLYAYSANAHAMNENKGRDLGQALIVEADEESGIVADTIYICDLNKVHLLFGLSETEDSVPVHSRKIEYSGNDQVNGYICGAYVVFAEKADQDSLTYQFGMSSYGQVDGAGSNAYGFGDNKVLYLGEAAKAFADVKAQSATRIANAKAILAASAANESQAVKNVASRVTRRLADAEKLAAGEVTTTQQLSALVNAVNYGEELAGHLDELATGINTVTADFVKANVVKGVYNLSGVKVADDINSLRALGKGLYIINGKKYVVK